MSKITQKQQAANIIEWLTRLPNFRKTTSQLGRKLDEKWEYCCLGVGCRIKYLPTNYEDGYSDGLVNIMCLNSPAGVFKDRNDSLANINDNLFGDDTDFTNMRKAMLLNLDKWIAKPGVAKIVKHHFKETIKALKTDPQMEILK